MKKWIPIAAIMVALVVVAYASTTKIVFEAESYKTITPTMAKVASSVASHGYYIQVPLHRPHGEEEGAPSDQGNALYKIHIPAEGQYRFWGRCHWYDGCGNSFFLKFDNKPMVVFGQDGTYQTWHWVKGPKISLTKGVHTIVIQNREDGAKLDEAMLTTDMRYVPVRAERETSSYVIR